ncbi:MAG: TonB-dependent receptor [Gammaproteobacteria bacterium]|nr:TonB-dependent receptor [Gammaproteobacteria bacterium]
MKTDLHFRLSGAAALIAAIGLHSQAIAQAPSSPQASGRLEEITVTARRQEESMQRTPVAVTAISGKLLDTLNVQDVTRLAQLAPNLVITQQTSSLNAAAIFIRGIGQTEPAATAEAGVAIYLDGVYVARTAGAIFDLVDVERIEVLRGPQGTLFGRNTTGGAVHLVSKKPADDFGLEAKAGYGSFDDWYTRARVDTGLIGDSTIKATLAYLHRERDGYFDNKLANDAEDPGSLDNNSIWLGLHGDFGEKLSADLTYDYGKRKGSPVFFQMVAATDDVRNYYGASPTFGGAPFIITEKRLDDGLQAPFDGRFHSEGEVSGTALTLQYDINDALAIKSVTAYREFEQDTICSLTGNGVMRGFVLDPVTFAPVGIEDLNGPYGCNNAPQKQDQTSQELQLVGGTERWKYVAGVFYFEESADEYNSQRLTVVLPGGQAGLNLAPLSSFGGDTESKAIFAQASYTPDMLDDRLEFTVGGRYTRDEKTFWSSSFPEKGDKDFDNDSWLLSVNYQFTDDMMGYARVSTGYKAGGFSPRAAVLSTFEPEEALAWELGFKAEWLDNRVRTNVALFHTTYDDLQISQFLADSSGSAAVIVNAGEATFQGVEVELAAVLTENLTVTATFGYTDPTYEEYLYRDPTTNNLIDVSDEARFVQLVRNNWRVGAEYVFPGLSFGELSARMDYAQSSERYMFPLDWETPFNEEIHDPGHENLSARISLTGMQLGNSGNLGPRCLGR